MNIFKSVKEAVSVMDAASFYGIKVNRSGLCNCPFHNDKTPSMKIDIRYKSSHKLRFTVASTLKAAGVETAYLQKTLGHSNRAMTEHYIYETVAESDDVENQLMNALSIG